MRLWKRLVGLAMISCLATAIANQDAEPFFVIQVVDTEGQPIPKVRVRVRLSYGDTLYTLTDPEWQSVSLKGQCVIEKDASYIGMPVVEQIMRTKSPLKLTIEACAPGYIPVRGLYQGPWQREIRLTMRKGQTLDLFLRDSQNRPLTLSPSRWLWDDDTSLRIAPANHQAPIIDMVDLAKGAALDLNAEAENDIFLAHYRSDLFQPFGLFHAGEGHYQFTLPEGYDQPILLLVSDEQVIQGYRALLQPAEYQKRQVQIQLPEPGEAIFELDLSAFLRKNPSPKWVEITLRPPISDFHVSIPLLTKQVPIASSKISLRVSGLAPGEWQASLSLGRRRWDRDYYESKQIQIKSGETTRLQTALLPFDPKRYQGKRRVTVQVRTAGGKPSANQPYTAYLQVGWNQHPIQQGRTNAQGQIVLKNLYENKRETDPQDAVRYLVQVGDVRQPIVLWEGDGRREYVITLTPQLGDPAPDVRLKSLADGKTITLSQFRSKWVYLEFWATWCGPCQTALRELKSVLDQYGQQWADRLQVITVSVDDTESVIKPHLVRQGWWEMALHCWDMERLEGKGASEAYAVSAVPSAFLIDPDGKIVWSGNPIRQVEALLKRYLGGAQ